MAKEGSIPESTPEETTPKMVEVSIPRPVGNEDPNYFVSVNGVNYILPKGKKSKVPDYVAAEIERSLKAEDRYHEKADTLRNAAMQPTADANIT